MTECYTQQYRPRIITGVHVLPPEGEDENRNIALIDTDRSITTAFSVLPSVGDEIFLDLKNGQTAILEVVGIMHWAQEIAPGQTEFDNEKKWVDVTLTCRQRSIAWSSERRGGHGVRG